MSKQDRQGVRTARDIEQKYDLGQLAAAQGMSQKQELAFNQLSQTLNQYMASTNGKIDELNTKVDEMEVGSEGDMLKSVYDTDNNGKVDDADKLGGQTPDYYAPKSEIPIISDWAKEPNKPTYTASEVGADAQGVASILVSAHNTGTDAHNDIRVLIQDLTARLDAVANSSDEELDQLSEIVEYIKSNKSLIDSITTSKVNVVDIVDNLTTNVGNKPLSAAQGVVLKALIDAITVPTKVSQLENDKGYLTQHQDLSAYAKKTDIPTIPSSLPANGGNSDTVDGYHIRKTTNENDTGQVGSITFIV